MYDTMVLNQLRARLAPIMSAIGRALGGAGITPNILTAISFVLAITAGLLFVTEPFRSYLAAVAILCSGALDVLDGAVARATGKVSTLGSLNDSTLDRISEVVIYAGIAYQGGVYRISPVVVLLTLAFSLLVSYVRAKGESLSIKMSGIGIGERAERLLVLIFFALIGFAWIGIGIYIIFILAILTFVQRYIYVARKLQEKKKVEQS
jgi:archaetidylinositol phosphate synthase